MTAPTEAMGAQRLPRLLALVPWLRTHPGIALTEAAESFGVTPRQLRADLELLFLQLTGGSAPSSEGTFGAAGVIPGKGSGKAGT